MLMFLLRQISFFFFMSYYSAFVFLLYLVIKTQSKTKILINELFDKRPKGEFFVLFFIIKHFKNVY